MMTQTVVFVTSVIMDIEIFVVALMVVAMMGCRLFATTVVMMMVVVVVAMTMTMPLLLVSLLHVGSPARGSGIEHGQGRRLTKIERSVHTPALFPAVAQ